MIAFASVDLPEPLGPIRAWICTLVDGQVEALEDRLVAGADMKISDF